MILNEDDAAFSRWDDFYMPCEGHNRLPKPKNGGTVAAKLNRIVLEAAAVRATSDSAQCSARH
jgi:hypothetical protein